MHLSAIDSISKADEVLEAIQSQFIDKNGEHAIIKLIVRCVYYFNIIQLSVKCLILW